MSSKKATKGTSYVKVPEARNADRTVVLLGAATQSITTAEAARLLGMSRKQCQHLANRGLWAFIEATDPQPPGRPAKPASLRQLEEENERLRRENARLQEQAQTAERVLEAAADMLKTRATAGRQRGAKSRRGGAGSSGTEEPDGAQQLLDGAATMRTEGAKAKLCAVVAGVSPATLRRWQARVRRGDVPRLRRGGPRRAPPEPVAVARATELVRAFHGHIGADSLRRRMVGVSRRQAAHIAAETRTALERERKHGSAHVVVQEPGVVRGFDAMEVKTTAGKRHLLIAADAAVPFRTSVACAHGYTGNAVADALERDFREHGAPLVLRMDRAKQHATAAVCHVLDRFGVLVLHGPAHYPRFYGQLERQNREHRCWLDAAGELDPNELELASTTMISLFNSELPRRKLGFRTAAEAWFSRPKIALDRSALRAEVVAITARIEPTIGSHDLAERFAIQAALAQLGLVRITKGASVLPGFDPR